MTIVDVVKGDTAVGELHLINLEPAEGWHCTFKGCAAVAAFRIVRKTLERENRKPTTNECIFCRRHADRYLRITFGMVLTREGKVIPNPQGRNGTGYKYTLRA